MDKPRNVAVYMRVARAPRAWIYCRTAEPNAFALRRQQEELTAFAKDNHYEVVGCTAKQETGTTMVRSGMAEITNAVLRGGGDGHPACPERHKAGARHLEHARICWLAGET